MSRPPASVHEHASQQGEPEGRAKHIRRAEDPCRLQAAGRFAAACIVAGSSLAAVGRAWGVEEKTAREVRDGTKPLTGERIEALPVSVRRAYAQSLLDDADGVAPRSLREPTAHHLAIAEKGGELAAVISAAVADGVIDETEALGILRVAAELEARAHAMVLDLRRGGR